MILGTRITLIYNLYVIIYLKTVFSVKILILTHIFSRLPTENVLLHLFYSHTFCSKMNIKEDITRKKKLPENYGLGLRFFSSNYNEDKIYKIFVFKINFVYFMV